MIKRIFAITLTSFREMYRDRFFLVLLLGVVFFFALSYLLGELSFEEQTRILFDLGISAIHWLNLGLCVFLGGSSLRREIERQTYMTLLSSPLSRLELVLGKFLGIFAVSLISTTILGAALFYLVRSSGSVTNFFIICGGIITEAAVLLSLSIVLSLVLSPFISVFTSFGIFLTAQWLESLNHFAQKSKIEAYIQFASAMEWVFPNLFRLNWRSPYILENGLPANIVIASLLHGWMWAASLLLIACLMFRRKNLI